nr:hypothetical protein GCM10017745_84240 [Saccharothrix mutabilis subsp. capreolus]
MPTLTASSGTSRQNQKIPVTRLSRKYPLIRAMSGLARSVIVFPTFTPLMCPTSITRACGADHQVGRRSGGGDSPTQGIGMNPSVPRVMMSDDVTTRG